ncbi:MAG: STAS domain-containing protein [Deltaproteobacteria bacterium]|jgi:anti-anti-sigma factor|nr:STAS domain-containing protein [Deltaproteobacteria bacterium]
MQVATADKGAYTLLSVSGRMDATSSPGFDDAARALGPRIAKNVLLDLQGLEFVSSSGLRSFLALAKTVQRAGFQTAFCSLGPMIEEVFRIAGFMSILKIYPDESSAAAGLAVSG